MIDPADFIISRKRKKYKFALFANSPLCAEYDEWDREFCPDIIEVGAGTGLFAVGLAERYPDKRVLAVDVKADRLQKGAGLAAEKGLTNVRFLRARVDQLGDLLSPHSVEAVWVTFPDPFPRKRSAKNRLTHPRFLALYQKLLQPQGSVCFKTDAPELFAWSLEQLVAERWHIAQLSFDLHDSTLPDDYKLQTTYERRFMAEGLPIQFVRASIYKSYIV